MELLVATSNNHKLQELRKILPESFKILGLDELGVKEEIPETGVTFRENALLKARYLYKKLHRDCLADDSGLEVTALGGEPGVFSARYSGPGSTGTTNVEKLLKKLQGHSDREACFKTVLALIIAGKEFIFEGTVRGVITENPSGKEGFGYDPVFIPDGYTLTFAQMPASEKNRISHRARAAGQLREFLENYPRSR